MLLRRKIEDVGFSCGEVGEAIARATDSQQREVLIAMADTANSFCREGGSWAMQCRAIIDGQMPGRGLSTNDRIKISVMLGCLIDHLNEPVTSC